MNSEQQSRLQKDVDLGQRAQHVLDLYLDDFIKRIEQELYNHFLGCQPDSEQLMELKRLSMAIGTLKTRVLSDIDSGKVALQQLSETRKH